MCAMSFFAIPWFLFATSNLSTCLRNKFSCFLSTELQIHLSRVVQRGGQFVCVLRPWMSQFTISLFLWSWSWYRCTRHILDLLYTELFPLGLLPCIPIVTLLKESSSYCYQFMGNDTISQYHDPVLDDLSCSPSRLQSSPYFIVGIKLICFLEQETNRVGKSAIATRCTTRQTLPMPKAGHK